MVAGAVGEGDFDEIVVELEPFGGDLESTSAARFRSAFP